MRHIETQASRDHEHTQILSALMRHDGLEAVRWMTNHLTSSVRLSAQHLIRETGETERDIALPKVAEVVARFDISAGIPAI
jgi:DNA-binding GntR family transcriptional regulator